jgi:plasmid maintenance system antidote protein VapI
MLFLCEESTALRLSKFFSNSAKFWLRLQEDVDIEDEARQKDKVLKSIKQFDCNAVQQHIGNDRTKVPNPPL